MSKGDVEGLGQRLVAGTHPFCLGVQVHWALRSLSPRSYAALDRGRGYHPNFPKMLAIEATIAGEKAVCLLLRMRRY